MPMHPKSLGDFATTFHEIVTNIQAIKGKRYATLLVTIFNVWGLGSLVVYLSDHKEQRFPELVLGETVESCIALYIDEDACSVEEYNAIFEDVERDLKMLIKNKQEFDMANKAKE